MSLQYLLDEPETRYAKEAKPYHYHNNQYILTRSNTPENEKNYYEGSNDKISTMESLVPQSRILSSDSASSINSFDGADAFEIDVQPKRKKFNNVEERRQFVEEYKRKYKTEMCKNWELRGTCKFGDKCCFAHGRNELKAKVLTHVKYKTKPCKQYHQTGYCPYGQRCQYLHKEAIEPNVFCNPAEGRLKHNPQLYDTLYEVNRLCATECELKAVMDKMPKRSRLGIFEKCLAA